MIQEQFLAAMEFLESFGLKIDEAMQARMKEVMMCLHSLNPEDFEEISDVYHVFYHQLSVWEMSGKILAQYRSGEITAKKAFMTLMSHLNGMGCPACEEGERSQRWHMFYGCMRRIQYVFDDFAKIAYEYLGIDEATKDEIWEENKDRALESWVMVYQDDCE